MLKRLLSGSRGGIESNSGLWKQMLSSSIKHKNLLEGAEIFGSSLYSNPGGESAKNGLLVRSEIEYEAKKHGTGFMGSKSIRLKMCRDCDSPMTIWDNTHFVGLVLKDQQKMEVVLYWTTIQQLQRI